MRRTKEQVLAEIRALKSDKNNYSEAVVRADPYSLVADRMMEKVPHSEIFAGMTHKQVRAYCKDPIMTAMYNSRRQPELAFGEDSEELEAFYDTLAELFPGAMNVLEALNDRWDNTTLAHTWETPDGHIAHVNVMEDVTGHLDNEGLDLPYLFKNNQPSNTKTSLAPNYTHSNDGFTIRHVADNVEFDFAHVHDDLQSHPNHMGKVRELYVDSFRVISEGKYLEKFCEQDFKIDNTAFLAGLKDSSYALC